MSSQSNLALCANLNDLVKKVILAFCEVNVSFKSRLDVYGSVHVRSDDNDVTSFILNEHCRKDDSKPESNGELTVIRQTSRSDGTHKVTMTRCHNAQEGLSNGYSCLEENCTDAQSSRLVADYAGEGIDELTNKCRELDANSFHAKNSQSLTEPLRNNIPSPIVERQLQNTTLQPSKKRSRRDTSNGEEIDSVVEGMTVLRECEKEEAGSIQHDSHSWDQRDGGADQDTVKYRRDEVVIKEKSTKKIKQEVTHVPRTEVKSEPPPGENDVIDLEYDDDENYVDNNDLDYNYDAANGVELADDGQMEYQNNQGYSHQSQADLYNQQLTWVQSNSGGGGYQAAPHDAAAVAATKGFKRSASAANVCGYCMKKCATSVQLRIHVQRHHKATEHLKNEEQGYSSGQSPAQASPSGYFPQTALPQQPQQTGEGGVDRLVCSACDLSFKSLDGLRCHENSKHSMNKVYHCQFCSQAFLTRQAAYTHRVRFHRVKPKLVH